MEELLGSIVGGRGGVLDWIRNKKYIPMIGGGVVREYQVSYVRGTEFFIVQK